MPKKNQIQFFCEQPLSGGRTAYHWKPSPKYRALGWTNLALGSDYKAAIAAAIDRNAELAAWETGAVAQAARALPPTQMNFGQLIDHYKASSTFADLKPKTRTSYASSLRILERKWAMEGRLMIRDLDRDMIMDLRNALVTDGRRHRTAALMRTLGIVLQYAEDNRLGGSNWTNPARRLKIPTPRARRKRIMIETLPVLQASCRALDLPHVELAILAGFFTFQREGDLLALTEFMVTRLDDMSGDARRALAASDGSVIGLRKQQEKTGEWVAVPFVGELRTAVESAIAARRAAGATCTNIIQRPGDNAPCAEWRLQRDFRAATAHARAHAVKHGLTGLLGLLTGLQFRDLRRSGMCWMRDLGVTVPMIAAISGHSIEYTQKILDTYMPSDPRAAAEGMAMALSRQNARDADEKEGAQ